ncbi:MAG: hypothetical protein U9O96_00030 [Candidatus Thermoplasmatota archaeon]|nr:hypothetical protein [Candidatus Thermoplasmatota archaeon]
MAKKKSEKRKRVEEKLKEFGKMNVNLNSKTVRELLATEIMKIFKEK